MTNTVAYKDALTRDFSSEIQNRGMSPLQSLTVRNQKSELGKMETQLVQLANIAFTEFKTQRGEVLLI